MTSNLNICATLFNSTTTRDTSLKNAGLLASDGSANGNWNVFLGESLNIPFNSDGTQPTADCYILKLSAVAYEKGLYAPGTMKLTFTVSGRASSGTLENALIKTFSGIKTSLFGYNELARTKQGDGTVTITYSDIIYLLKDYYLQSVMEKDGGKSCVLTWRSPDFALTREKGCEVFEASRFGKDIFSAKAGSVTLSEGGTGKMGYEYSPSRLLMMGYNSSDVTRNGYHKEKKEDVIGHDGEIIQPYLVRYNESVYDFLARVAHRCGEFLYYEYDDKGGKFCLGLPEETVKHIVKNEGYNVPDKLPFCSYRSLGGDDQDDAVSFSTDYLKCCDSVAADGTYYDVQHTSDDFLYRLTVNDKVTDDPSAMSKLDANQEITKLLSPIFTADGIIPGLTAAASVLLQDVVDTYGINKDKLHDQFEGYKSESESTTSNFTYGLNNAFLHTVQTCEEKSERHTVLMDFTDSLPTLRIGEDIDLSDGLYKGYVIAKESGTFTYSSDTQSVEASNKAEAVPVVEVTGLNTLPRMAFPPAAGIAHSIKATAMEAIVVRTDDPLFLGRVKVRYPWQFNEDGEPDDSKDTPKESKIPLSPWIRVITPFTGGPKSLGSGVYFPLSAGERVLLNYVDGNIERPYVAGSLYFRNKGESDSEKPESHGPERGNFEDTDVTFYQTDFSIRSILSAKGHGLMFKDTDDTSPFSLIPGLGTLEQLIKLIPGVDKELPIDFFKGGGISLGDGTGVLSVEMDADKRKIDFSSPLGSMAVSAFTGISINVPNGDIGIEGKNIYIEAGNNLTLKSGTNLRKKGRDSAYAGQLVGSLLVSSGAQILAQTTGVDLAGCLDLSFLRCIMEIVMRPVEGTLRIHSGRNATVTAGSGEVTIPTSLLSKKSREYNDDDYTKDITEAFDVFDKAVGCVKDFWDEAVAMKGTLDNCISNFQNALTDDNRHNNKTVDFQGTSHGDTYWKYVDPANTNRKNDVIDAFCVNNNPLASLKDIYGDRQDLYSAIYEKVKKEYKNLIEVAAQYKKFIDTSWLQDELDKNEIDKVKINNFGGEWKKIPILDDKWVDWDPNDSNFVQCKKQMMRDVVIQLILGCENMKLLRSKDDPSKLISASCDTVKYAGGAAEWGNYFGSDDKASLENYIIGGSADYPWGAVSLALVDSAADDDASDDTKTKILHSTLGGMASLLGGGAEYDSDEGKWTSAPQVKKLINYDGEAGPRSHSDISDKGGIMFSNTKGSTLQVSANTDGWESHPNVKFAKSLADHISAISRTHNL